MALYSLLRRTTSSVVPLAIRAVGSARTFHGGALSAALGRRLRLEVYRRSYTPPLHFYTTAVEKKQSSDERLLRIIDSEIGCAEEDNVDLEEETPDGFPFVIHNNPGERTILLKRVYQDETIEVEVDTPNFENEEDNEDDNGDGGDDESSNESSVPLVVTVSKQSGLHLQFGVSAFPDEIAIESLSIKNHKSSEDELAYEGPEFSDLDENFQKAFHKYLETRGIKPSITNFLREYMASKDSKEYLQWLKSLKKFVET